jgi:hypothetical protein
MIDKEIQRSRKRGQKESRKNLEEDKACNEREMAQGRCSRNRISRSTSVKQTKESIAETYIGDNIKCTVLLSVKMNPT